MPRCSAILGKRFVRIVLMSSQAVRVPRSAVDAGGAASIGILYIWYIKWLRYKKFYLSPELVGETVGDSATATYLWILNSKYILIVLQYESACRRFQGLTEYIHNIM